MLYNTLVLLISRGRLEGLRVRIDTLYALGRLTGEQYTTLCEFLEANG